MKFITDKLKSHLRRRDTYIQYLQLARKFQNKLVSSPVKEK